MRKKKLVKNMFFIVVNLILFFIISIINKDMQKAVTLYRIDRLNFYIIIIGLILFMFGLLIEYDRLLQTIKAGFKINKLKFLLAIIMLIISCLPYGYLIHINIGELLNAKVVRCLFSIWSGILISRSLMIKTVSLNE